MKRVRKHYPSEYVKYFFVGEYGEENHRPHYHALLYGVSPAELELLKSCWTDPKTKESKGFVSAYELNVQTAQYVCKYTTKGATTWTDPRIRCRHPEFMRCSNGL